MFRSKYLNVLDFVFGNEGEEARVGGGGGEGAGAGGAGGGGMRAPPQRGGCGCVVGAHNCTSGMVHLAVQ